MPKKKILKKNLKDKKKKKPKTKIKKVISSNTSPPHKNYIPSNNVATYFNVPSPNLQPFDFTSQVEKEKINKVNNIILNQQRENTVLTLMDKQEPPATKNDYNDALTLFKNLQNQNNKKKTNEWEDIAEQKVIFIEKPKFKTPLKTPYKKKLNLKKIKKLKYNEEITITPNKDEIIYG